MKDNSTYAVLNQKKPSFGGTYSYKASDQGDGGSFSWCFDPDWIDDVVIVNNTPEEEARYDAACLAHPDDFSITLCSWDDDEYYDLFCEIWVYRYGDPDNQDVSGKIRITIPELGIDEILAANEDHSWEIGSNYNSKKVWNTYNVYPEESGTPYSTVRPVDGKHYTITIEKVE